MDAAARARGETLVRRPGCRGNQARTCLCLFPGLSPAAGIDTLDVMAPAPGAHWLFLVTLASVSGCLFRGLMAEANAATHLDPTLLTSHASETRLFVVQARAVAAVEWLP